MTKVCQDPKKEDIFTGLKCQVECLPGYQIEGLDVRTCLKNGTWSGIPPTCIGKDKTFHFNRNDSVVFLQNQRIIYKVFPRIIQPFLVSQELTVQV